MVNKNIKKKPKLKLGKKTNEGYEYSAKVDFKEDLSKQISGLIQEKKASDELEMEIKKLRKEIKEISDEEKEKNLQYYYLIGKKLLFLDTELFKEVAPHSVLRRVIEELPEILPSIKNIDMAVRHLYFMHWIGHLEKKSLLQASWEQWFEITKFRGLYKKRKLLKLILKECKVGVTGHETLNRKIKELLKKDHRNKRSRN